MDEDEQDLTPDGEPEPDNADLKAGDSAPFQPNNDPLDVEQEQESPDDLADEAQSITDSMESALDDTEQDEDMDASLPERGETIPSHQQDSYENPPEPDSGAPGVAGDQPAPAAGDHPLLAASQMSMPEAPPPTASELSDITEALNGLGGGAEATEGDSFGEQVNAFNEAGGADEGGGGGIPGGESGDSGGGGISDFADASVRHAQQQDDMLTEYVRRLDEMTRRLESERL